MYGQYGVDSERPSACKFYYVSPLTVKLDESQKAEGKSKVQDFTFAFCLLTSHRLRLLNAHGPEERHQAAQPLADFLDLQPGFNLALLFEPGPAGRVLLDPGLRELTALDLAEHLLHFLPGRLGHDARPTGVVA